MSSQEAPTPLLHIRDAGRFTAQNPGKSKRTKNVEPLALRKKALKSPAGTAPVSRHKPAVKDASEAAVKSPTQQRANPADIKHVASRPEAGRLAVGSSSHLQDTSQVLAVKADQSQVSTPPGLVHPPATATDAANHASAQVQHARPPVQHQAFPSQSPLQPLFQVPPQQNSPDLTNFIRTALPLIEKPQAAQIPGVAKDTVYVDLSGGASRQCRLGLAPHCIPGGPTACSNHGPSRLTLAEDLLLPAADLDSGIAAPPSSVAPAVSGENLNLRLCVLSSDCSCCSLMLTSLASHPGPGKVTCFVSAEATCVLLFWLLIRLANL